MRLTISRKLILAFLLLTLLVLIATLALARWSFERGFLDYVNALEIERLEIAAGRLSDEYLQADYSWSSLTPGRFDQLTRGFGPNGRLPGRGAGPVPPPFGRGAEGRPPPGRSGPRRGPERQSPPTALLDLDEQYIAGQKDTAELGETIRVSVVAQGEPIGTLVSRPRRQFTSVPETAFAQQQLRASWLIGAACLLLALLVSVLLSRGLLAPIRRMIRSVEQLSNGNYSVRINEARRDEIGQLMADLDRLGTTLEQSQSMRRRWLADVSHELRTPITVLTGELQALKDGLRTFDQNQADSFEQEVQRLRFLVDDLYELSVSDVGGLRYEFATVNLTEVVRMTIDSIRERAADAGVEVKLNVQNNVYARVDAKRIDQMLRNVLENSLKYTDSPGRIDVNVQRIDTVIRMEIQDTPPGVSPTDCEKLFDPLYRIEASRSRRTGGAGLGLAICRNIVEAHGGTLDAAPSALGGLLLRVELPAQNEEHV